MSIDPSRLLQMLEPAVRPGAAQRQGGAQQGRPAFEKTSFQDLLTQAAESPTQAEGKESAAGAGEALKALGGFGQIENATLRNVLAQAGQAGQPAADKA